jgi:23S rRNA pseudouridine1911/1915/1917 synthase
MRLDLALIGLHPSLSRRRARAAIEKGQVTVDGVRIRAAGHDVAEGAKVDWDPHRKALPRARCSLPILHEDEHVLVIDKPAGLLSVPTPGRGDEDTALARVRDYVAHLRPPGAFAERVHRLDRGTSGALAFALSREARAGLIPLFRAHRIERRYLALVEGEPDVDRGVVDVPIRDEWVSGRRAVARDPEAGKPARTRWRVRERLGGATLLEVDLDTGRQHQIRVHLAHLGLPVLGDRVYGRSAQGRSGPRRPPLDVGRPPLHVGRPPLHVGRPLLHACRLAFVHPVTGEKVAAGSPLPHDFRRALARLRGRAQDKAARTLARPSGESSK